MSIATELTQQLILDGTKIQWHLDRVQAWERGEHISPITIDMSLNQACQAKCKFCYMQLQKQDRYERITFDIMKNFLDDCAELDVKGISLVSDGESTLSKAYIPTIKYGASLGISMASGTNGERLDTSTLEKVLPYLTYLRINFSGGTRERYSEIMGVKPEFYDKVCSNIKDAVFIKKRDNLKVTIGMQMVLRPQDADQILLFARLGKELRPDYAVIKHCSDDEFGSLGINYSEYEKLYDLLREAESLSDDTYKVVAKWSKIKQGSNRTYQRCYGPPFILQISGSGLVAPCGMLFNDRYKDKFHIGNIVTERFKDIVRSDRYWEIVNYLASPSFDAQSMCGTLCLQHKTNEALDNYKKGLIELNIPNTEPLHKNFI